MRAKMDVILPNVVAEFVGTKRVAWYQVQVPFFQVDVIIPCANAATSFINKV